MWYLKGSLVAPFNFLDSLGGQLVPKNGYAIINKTPLKDTSQGGCWWFRRDSNPRPAD